MSTCKLCWVVYIKFLVENIVFKNYMKQLKCGVNKLPAAIVISTTAFSSSVINRYRRNKYLIHIQHINKQHEIMQN